MHPLEWSPSFPNISLYAEQVKCSLLPCLVTFKDENSPFIAEYFGKLFVELTLHLTKIASAHTALTNCTINYAFAKERHISSAQKSSIMNAKGNKCHNIDEFTCKVRIAELLVATDNKKGASSSFLPCAYFTACSPSSPSTSSLTSDLPLTLLSAFSNSPSGTFSRPTPSPSASR